VDADHAAAPAATVAHAITAGTREPWTEPTAIEANALTAASTEAVARDMRARYSSGMTVSYSSGVQQPAQTTATSRDRQHPS
jgi:hypothetical protein